jgi:hypothetical protein
MELAATTRKFISRSCSVRANASRAPLVLKAPKLSIVQMRAQGEKASRRG